MFKVLLIWLCESVSIVASMLNVISIIYNETRRKLSGNGNKMWENVTPVIVNDFARKAYIYSVLRGKTTGIACGTSEILDCTVMTVDPL